MAKRVLVPLAEGFEEIEAVTVIDVLRRAGIEVVTAGLEDGPVRASRGVVVVPETTLAAASQGAYDAVVLPGGGPGSERLAASPVVADVLARAMREERLVAAICAAPAVVLAPLGHLEGRRATCYPALSEKLPEHVAARVVEDGNLVTSQGPGTALDFALTLVARLAGPDTAEEVRAAALA